MDHEDFHHADRAGMNPTGATPSNTGKMAERAVNALTYVDSDHVDQPRASLSEEEGCSERARGEGLSIVPLAEGSPTTIPTTLLDEVTEPGYNTVKRVYPSNVSQSETALSSEHARRGSLSSSVIEVAGESLTPTAATLLDEVTEADNSTVKRVYPSNASRSGEEAGSEIFQNEICAPITIYEVLPTPTAIAEAEHNTSEDIGPVNTSHSREETCSEDARRRSSPTQSPTGSPTGPPTDDPSGSWHTLRRPPTVKPADSTPSPPSTMSAYQPGDDTWFNNTDLPNFDIADEFFSLRPALPFRGTASSPPPPAPSSPPPPAPSAYAPPQGTQPDLAVNTDITPHPNIPRPITPLLPDPLYQPYDPSGPFPPPLYDPTSPDLPSFVQSSRPLPASPPSSDTTVSSSILRTTRRLDPRWPTVLKGYINTLPFELIDTVFRVEAKFLSPQIPEIKYDGVQLVARGKTTGVYAAVAKPAGQAQRGGKQRQQGQQEAPALHWDGQAIALKRYRNADAEHKKDFTLTGTDMFEDLATELRILDQLEHRHVVTLLGVFRRKNIPGSILAPAAVCDLEDFLDSFGAGEQGGVVPSLWTAFEFSSPDYGEVAEHPGSPSSLPPSHVTGASGRGKAKAKAKANTRGRKDRKREEVGRMFGTAHAWLLSHTACLLNALEYIHDQKICHRDIRAENVLLTHDRVYFCDFGGSKDYKPPEAKKGDEQQGEGESSAPKGGEGSAAGGSAVLARPSGLGELYDREFALFAPLWKRRVEIRMGWKRDGVMLCGVFLEMALARDYETRAVMGQDWEAVWTDGSADGVIAWVKRVKALREGEGVADEPSRTMLKVVEVIALFAIQGWLRAEEVTGWIGGNEAAMWWLVRGCCDGEEVEDESDEGGYADGGRAAGALGET